MAAELIYGKLRVADAPMPRHQRVVRFVFGAPDLVIEVLSPHPRIGKLGERIGWFQQYGVRECWLIHQLEHRVEMLNFVGTNVIERASFDDRTPIRSRVLPEFDRTLASMLRWQ